MKLRSTFTISLCLNLALAGVAVCLLKKTASSMSRATAPTISEPTTVPTVGFLSAANTSFASVVYVTNRFNWGNVEAEDFEQLATNLRVIGCPEKTVRDVVVARARRLLQRLSRSAEPKLSFWAAGLRRAHAQREAEREVAAARAKLVASVERALGRDVFTEDGKLMDDFVTQAVVRFLSGPMSEEKFSRLAVVLTRQEARRDEVRARTQGVLLEEDETVLKNLGRQFQQELATVLSPVELEEFTARPGMLKLTDQIRFEATDLSPAEIRAVALIHARFDDPAMGEWFSGNSMTDQQVAQVTKAIREFLGESRYAQVERAGDGNFKTLFDVGRDNNLPHVAAVKAFELRQLTAQEVTQLREDKFLSDAERQQRLAQMQTQAQEGILKVLGAAASQQYLQRGGSWVTNVSGL